MILRYMRYLATGLVTLLLSLPALLVELFRYRGAAKDGGTLEYVFQAGEQNSPTAVSKEKAAEIAADFMTTFYHVQVGALETQEFRTIANPPVRSANACRVASVRGQSGTQRLLSLRGSHSRGKRNGGENTISHNRQKTK
jgi:hypothetical protein